MDITVVLVALLALLVGIVLGLRWAGRGGAGDPSGEGMLIRDGLDRLHEQLRQVEHQGVSWQSQLRQQVDDVRHSTDLLRRETGALSTALRRPHVRGQWGELHLRRAVELAGMVEHCDFDEQRHLVDTRDGDRIRRPDLVVNLAGGRCIVVDAKTPLEAYLDALAADDDDQPALLAAHAKAVRAHVDALAGKAYWASLPTSPDFVVLFVPSESCLSAAIEADPSLLEHGAHRNVMLASPTTLITLLRTAAHAWTTQALVESTREIHELGRELHARLGVMGSHLDKVGRSLKGAVEAYNATIGSLESRVLVTARQFEDIGVAKTPLLTPTSVDHNPRPLTAAELLEEPPPAAWLPSAQRPPA